MSWGSATIAQGGASRRQTPGVGALAGVVARNY